MKPRRRRTASEQQLNLFSVPRNQIGDKRMVGEEPRRPSWVEQNWPEYAHESQLSDYPALRLWAQTFDQVPVGARLLLQSLCSFAEKGPIKASIPDLAKDTGSSVNGTRQRIDQLLVAGIILVRPWMVSSRKQRRLPRGYEFRLVVDFEDEIKARRAGFRSTRKSSRSLTSGGVVR